jgi:hypothetical protein
MQLISSVDVLVIFVLFLVYSYVLLWLVCNMMCFVNIFFFGGFSLVNLLETCAVHHC